jgi:phage shock protein E
MNSFPAPARHPRHRSPYRQVLGMLSGLALVSILAFSPLSWSAPETIAAPALHQRLNTATAPLILDVRSPAEYATGHIPGARNIPYRELPTHLTELSTFREREVVVYCKVGVRAGIAEGLLEQAGFEQILSLEGDMQGWRDAKLPISTQVLENTP